MKIRILSLLALTGGLALTAAEPAPAAAPAAAPAPTAENIRAAIELLRSNVRDEKALIVAHNIVLTADEESEFWPVYTEYQAALAHLVDERLALFQEFVNHHADMSNEEATALAGKFFDWEAKRTEFKRAWFKKFSEVLPARKAAQVAQIENQINTAIDLLLQSQLPLLK